VSRTIHFLSGLPRSGSTLLAALLRQNPMFRAEMSSPVAVLCERLLPVIGGGEYSVFFDDTASERVLRSVIEGFYAPEPPDAVVVDTNRAWCAHLHQLRRLYPSAFVIACVRDPVWIMDSFERVVRANPWAVSKLFGPAPALTVFDRVEQLLSPQGSFGAAWQALQDAFYGDWAHRLILVDYDVLAAEPERVLALLYELLGLPPFQHDTNNVAYAGGAAFDAALRTPGLHSVRPRVAAEHRRTILPPQLVQRLAGKMFWRDPSQNPGGAFVIAPDQEAADGRWRASTP